MREIGGEGDEGCLSLCVDMCNVEAGGHVVQDAGGVGGCPGGSRLYY